MNVYQKHALRILDNMSLTLSLGKRVLRSEELLCRLEPLQEYAAIPQEEFCHGWAFHLGTCFADALDCQLQERTKDKQKYWIWTQGNIFDFRKGYTFHDTPTVSDEPWSDTLRKLSCSLTITESVPCSAQSDDSPRSAGMVSFQMYRPNAEKTALQPHGEIQTGTQDDFVRILIKGLTPEMSDGTS